MNFVGSKELGLTLDPWRQPGSQIERTKRQMRTLPKMIFIRKWVCLWINPLKNSAQKRLPTQTTTTIFPRVSSYGQRLKDDNKKHLVFSSSSGWRSFWERSAFSFWFLIITSHVVPGTILERNLTCEFRRISSNLERKVHIISYSISINFLRNLFLVTLCSSVTSMI